MIAIPRWGWRSWLRGICCIALGTNLGLGLGFDYMTAQQLTGTVVAAVDTPVAVDHNSVAAADRSLAAAEGTHAVVPAQGNKTL